jgi:hypothetical protein
MDVIAPNITPFTPNPKDENPPFVSLMETCPMLGDANV